MTLIPSTRLKKHVVTVSGGDMQKQAAGSPSSTYASNSTSSGRSSTTQPAGKPVTLTVAPIRVINAPDTNPPAATTPPPATTGSTSQQGATTTDEQPKQPTLRDILRRSQLDLAARQKHVIYEPGVLQYIQEQYMEFNPKHVADMAGALAPGGHVNQMTADIAVHALNFLHNLGQAIQNREAGLPVDAQVAEMQQAIQALDDQLPESGTRFRAALASLVNANKPITVENVVNEMNALERRFYEAKAPERQPQTKPPLKPKAYWFTQAQTEFTGGRDQYIRQAAKAVAPSEAVELASTLKSAIPRAMDMVASTVAEVQANPMYLEIVRNVDIDRFLIDPKYQTEVRKAVLYVRAAIEQTAPKLQDYSVENEGWLVREGKKIYRSLIGGDPYIKALAEWKKKTDPALQTLNTISAQLESAIQKWHQYIESHATDFAHSLVNNVEDPDIKRLEQRCSQQGLSSFTWITDYVMGHPEARDFLDRNPDLRAAAAKIEKAWLSSLARYVQDSEAEQARLEGKVTGKTIGAQKPLVAIQTDQSAIATAQHLTGFFPGVDRAQIINATKMLFPSEQTITSDHVAATGVVLRALQRAYDLDKLDYLYKQETNPAMKEYYASMAKSVQTEYNELMQALANAPTGQALLGALFSGRQEAITPQDLQDAMETLAQDSSRYLFPEERQERGVTVGEMFNPGSQRPRQ